MYLVMMVDDTKQARSLADYLTGHGLVVGTDGSGEVTVRYSKPGVPLVVCGMVKSWKRWWKFHDQEFVLPVSPSRAANL